MGWAIRPIFIALGTLPALAHSRPMAKMSDAPILVPILGDQLTRDLASIRGRTKDDTVILMMEVWDEATYVKHHKQKIVLIFSAMRHFAEELRDSGWTVDYVKLDAKNNAGSFTGEVARAVEEYGPRHQAPGLRGDVRRHRAHRGHGRVGARRRLLRAQRVGWDAHARGALLPGRAQQQRAGALPVQRALLGLADVAARRGAGARARTLRRRCSSSNSSCPRVTIILFVLRTGPMRVRSKL